MMSDFEKWLDHIQKMKHDDTIDDVFFWLYKLYDEVVLREHLYSGRWEETLRSVFRIDDRYLAIEWNEGLTEMQDADPCIKAYEVWPHTKEVIVYEPRN